MTDSPEILLSAPQLARLLSLGERQVRRLAQSKVLPRVGTGSRAKFDAYVCVPLYVAYVRRGDESSGDIAEARLRLTEAQRREIELRTRRAERQLLAFDEVANAFEAAMVTVGTQLDGLAGRMAGELAAINDPAQMRAKVFDETRRIRNAAADQLEALLSDSARSQSTTSTTTEDAGDVG